MKSQIRLLLAVIAIAFANLSNAKVEMDTITNWQFYKDSELLFKSKFLDSSIHTVIINSTEAYDNLMLSLFYDFNNEVMERKVEFVFENEVIATVLGTSDTRSKFRIPKTEIDKLFHDYSNKNLQINYLDKLNEAGFTIGILKLVDTKYSELSIKEVKQIIQKAIDLPELQVYLRNDSLVL